jgi:hypothetical protein
MSRVGGLDMNEDSQSTDQLVSDAFRCQLGRNPVQDSDKVEKTFFKQRVNRLSSLGRIGKKLCECGHSAIIPADLSERRIGSADASRPPPYARLFLNRAVDPAINATDRNTSQATLGRRSTNPAPRTTMPRLIWMKWVTGKRFPSK